MSRIVQAADRLSRAALNIGDIFARGEDPRWPDSQELEAAAMHYHAVYREAEHSEDSARASAERMALKAELVRQDMEGV